MSNIEDTVLDAFFDRLAKDDAVSTSIVDSFRAVLTTDNLPKAEQLVALLEASNGKNQV